MRQSNEVFTYSRTKFIREKVRLFNAWPLSENKISKQLYYTVFLAITVFSNVGNKSCP